MRIACIAQLVNVIAPIRAEKNGPAWRQTIYYPYQFASLYGRGVALNVAVDCPTYDCNAADDVKYLDVAGVYDEAEGMVTLFVLNRHLTEAAEINVSLTGFSSATLDLHLAMAGYDLRVGNGPDQPDRVVPVPGSGVGVEDGALKGSVPALSYHVLRLKVQ
ncbi:Intracellular exo-alpha-(1-_5)-L-arabinofuranosidase 1 [compost metagenome]